jgi:L-fuculose-phosphate aldolase
MRPEDLIVIDYSGKVVEGSKKPSSEMMMHVCIYQERPDVHGIVHAHPPKATGFAVAGIPLTQCVLPEVIVTLGGIPLAEYGTPGTDELYEPVRKYIQDYDAFLLENHGALTIGADVMNAYYKMETLEHFAHISLVAIQLGNLKALGKPDVQKLLALREKFGVKTAASCDVCDDGDSSSCSVTPTTGKKTISGLTEKIAEAVHRKAGSLPEDVSQEALIEAITTAILKRLKA